MNPEECRMCVYNLSLLHTEYQNPHSTSKVGLFFAKWGDFASPHSFKGLFEG